MRLSTVERVLFLSSVELFSHIAGEDLVPVAQAMEEVHFSAGETFVRQGDLGDSLYLLVDGTVSIVIRGVGEVASRGAKGVIGEMAIITHKPRSADCIAVSEVTALKLSQGAFWELLEQRPPLALGVIKMLAERLDEVVSRMQQLNQEKLPAL